jgi:hypothetical protein
MRIGGAKAASDSFDAPPSGQNLETGGAKSLSEPGILHIDEHVLWPARSEIVLGRYAESWRVNKKLVYEVRADDRPLASGVFGAWNLGAGTVDVDVTGARTLRLSTQVTRPANTLKRRPRPMRITKAAPCGSRAWPALRLRLPSRRTPGSPRSSRSTWPE